MNLMEHAQHEMKLAGLYEPDADYGGMVPKAVEELVKVFQNQGHSGYSADTVLKVFEIVAQYKTLSPITSDPEEWQNVSEISGRPFWQSRRDPSVFSEDGGQTWYSLEEQETE